VVIYEASTGSLCGAVPCTIVESGFTFKHTCVLVKADGTIQTKTTDTLKAVFGGMAWNPVLADGQLGGGRADAVGGIRDRGRAGNRRQGRVYFKSQWLNPLAGGMKTPVAADRRSVAGEVWEQIQALAGAGGPAMPPAAQRAAASPAAPRVPAVPRSAPVAPPQGATAHDGRGLGGVEPSAKPASRQMRLSESGSTRFPGCSLTRATPTSSRIEWGKLKAEFQDDVPM